MIKRVLVLTPILFLIFTSCTEQKEVPKQDRFGIYELDLETEDMVLLYSSTTKPNFLRLSNSGEEFAFSMKIGGDADTDEEIFTMNTDGTGLTQITDNEYMNIYPTWSADDSQIAFLTSRDTVLNLDIYIMDADGSNEYHFYDSGGHDADPHWVGHTIVFTAESKIWAIQDDASGLTQLTDPPKAGEWGNAVLPFGDYDPRLSPDESKVVFERMVDDESPHGNYDMYLVNADGTGETRLTNTGYTQGMANWSHDGEKLVFPVAAIGTTGHYHIYMMNSDGSDLADITPDYFPPGHFLCHSACFSADDSKVYMVCEWYDE